ncbi:Permease of the drug/metabolite transporter (DMT) superfamily [Desulfosporosinus sp. I2]|uniref:DMT family transporter n=1 Tax=Desulfosporosinus sp. I2 TaxID=1617025 RepID=UPI0005F04280|nr:DMT family transporter [Desulfosporosinus sp. I2]KJR45182.1 Permease of the drug/metabolite transporter (DMT) superfamily [Desulfosporosinus sp. I2]
MKLNKSQWADFSLLLVTLVWGSTFVIVKWAIEDLPPFPFLAIRFALAFISLLPFLWFQKAHISKGTLLKGVALGVFLFSGYAWQTVGLQYTTASNAGFITGLSVVFVPALVIVTTRRLPSPGLLLGILCALVGLAFLSLGDRFQLNKGDLMILACAISFALHIFLVGRYAPQTNATVLASVQILTVSILSGLFSFLLPQPSLYFSSTAWIALLVTAIPATSLAFFAQTKMQQFTTPTHTALIFSMEPVFAAISAFFFAGEILTTKGLIGAGLVLAGMLIAEFTGSKNE